MEPVSRRGFFKQAGAAAAVAAVAGSVAMTPLGIAGAAARTRSASEPELGANEDLGAHEDLVAHVKDARTGEISLFIGHREVTFHDRKVAARLVRATR
jgi:hypothetical protein